jgi:hypothetical protein
MFIGCSSYLFSSRDFTKSTADLVELERQFSWAYAVRQRIMKLFHLVPTQAQKFPT